jgi:hypothetical protein
MLGIYNAFDTSLQLIAAKFSDVQIDGIVYSRSNSLC